MYIITNSESRHYCPIISWVNRPMDRPISKRASSAPNWNLNSLAPKRPYSNLERLSWDTFTSCTTTINTIQPLHLRNWLAPRSCSNQSSHLLTDSWRHFRRLQFRLKAIISITKRRRSIYNNVTRNSTTVWNWCIQFSSITRRCRCGGRSLLVFFF